MTVLTEDRLAYLENPHLVELFDGLVYRKSPFLGTNWEMIRKLLGAGEKALNGIKCLSNGNGGK